jgi:protein-disulfide isomerase
LRARLFPPLHSFCFPWLEDAKDTAKQFPTTEDAAKQFPAAAATAAAATTSKDAAAVEDAAIDTTVVHIDAEANLDLVNRLNILSTPTTLILDKSGIEVGRAVGAPKRDEVLAAIASVK